MNRERLAELGFVLGDRATGGASQGAWFATGPDGAAVVLKWFPDQNLVDRYAQLLPALDELWGRGVPVPRYRHVLPIDGGTITAQQMLPGRSEDNPSPAVVDALVDAIAAKAGITGPATEVGSWGDFVVETLTVGRAGWAAHEPMCTHGPRTADLLDRIHAIGAEADPSWFREDGLVHLDLHTDNVLIDNGALTGIIDWDGACAGDHRFDLAAFVFDLDGHDQPIWEIVDAVGFAPEVLRAYVAVLALKSTSSTIQHRPNDLSRQLDRAERVFARYEL